MYIEPNTNIKFYSGIPLDNTYKNTLYFTNISAQNNYFHGSTPKYTLTRQSYQRVNKGVIRVALKAEQLYDCNYIAFQNESFKNDLGISKWFYAFVLNVEYVNNVTCEVTFQIDVLQTYMFDIELRESFIERQHSETDKLFENLNNEGFDFTSFNTNGADINEVRWTEYNVVIQTGVAFTVDEEGHYDWRAVDGEVINGIYSGIQNLRPLVVKNGEADPAGLLIANNLIHAIVDDNKGDSIVGAYMFPKDCAINQSYDKELEFEKIIDNISGYRPKNKKLFSSPYNWVYLTSNDGQSIPIMPEYINSKTKFTVTVMSTLGSKPEVLIVPRYYKNKTYNFDEVLTINNFPQCAINVDGYRAWLAQGGEKQLQLSTQEAMTKAAIGVATSTVDTVTSATTGNVGGVISGLGNVASGATDMYFIGAKKDLAESLAQNLPSSVKGTQIGSALVANQKQGFNIEHRCLPYQYAKLVDDYFTMYGYAQNCVDTPKIDARPHYTYIKTKGANIVGKCPSDDIRAICNIFDKGITFWKYANEVGDYSVDNRV